MKNKIVLWIKKEKILVISAFCALITMFMVPPDGEYPGYLDIRVLCLLFCLMAVVAGFQRCGAFDWLSSFLIRHAKGGRMMGIGLVMLPFFSSMLVTNDVALITFVPFTMMLLTQMRCEKAMIPILVLQTIAANLGSMATPVGNPQNLFLYAKYELSAGEFFSVMVPLTLLSLLVLIICSSRILPPSLPQVKLEEKAVSSKKLLLYAFLFLLCLMTVFRALPFPVLTIIIIAVIAVSDRDLLKAPDYGLLATFICFFIVSGNMGRIEAVRDTLNLLLDRSTLLTAAASSQVISNVPSAVLLSGFTDQWKPLLEGVNIGGLGTPIASLASLITLKIYLASEGAEGGRFLLIFTLANLAGLVILLTAAMLL